MPNRIISRAGRLRCESIPFRPAIRKSSERNAIFLPAIFISGVFYDNKDMPQVLKGVAEALPLKHVIDGLQGAIVTGHGVRDHWEAVIAISLWAIFGIYAAVRWFRWE